MNKLAKQMLRSFVIGGAIFAGMAINSTNSMAAEIETDDEQQVQTEEVSEEESSQATSQEDERIQAMEDATEVIEGDAVAEEGYGNQAKTAVENNELSEEQSSELKKAGEDVLNQAKEKIEVVRDAYEEIKSETESVESEVKSETVGTDLEGYSKKLEAIEGTEQKIDYLDELSETANQLYQDFVNEYGKDSETYNRVIDKIQETENNKEALYEEYTKILDEYSELEKQYNQLLEEVNSFEGSSEEKSEYYRQQVDELNRLREEFEQSCSRFDEVFYSREDLESRVAQMESNKSQGLGKVKEAVINNANEEELAAIVLECSKNIEEYNSAVEELDKWYSDLENAVSDRQEKKQAYNNQQQLVDSLNSGQKDDTQYEALLEKYTETKDKLSESGEKLSGMETELDTLSTWITKLYAYRDFLDKNIVDSDKLYNTAVRLINNYKTSLMRLSEAQPIYDRAEEAYKAVENSYNELDETIYEYNWAEKEEKIREKYLDDAKSKYEYVYGLSKEAEGYYYEAKEAYENNSLTKEEASFYYEKIKKIHDKLDYICNEEFQYLWQDFNRISEGYYYRMEFLKQEPEMQKISVDNAYYSIIYYEEKYEEVLIEYNKVIGIYGEALSIYENLASEEAKLEAEIKQIEREKQNLTKDVENAKTVYKVAVTEYNVCKSKYEENAKRIKELESLLDINPSEENLSMYYKALKEQERAAGDMSSAEEKMTNSLNAYNSKKEELSIRSVEMSSVIEEYNRQIKELYDNNVYYKGYKENAKGIIDEKNKLEKNIEESKEEYERQKLEYEKFLNDYPRMLEEEEKEEEIFDECIREVRGIEKAVGEIGRKVYGYMNEIGSLIA